MRERPGDLWRPMIEGRGADRLAREVMDALGIAVPPRPFHAACRRAIREAEGSSGSRLGTCGGNESWSDATWRCWLKNRAAEVGCYLAGCRGISLADATSCVLHVGFVGIVETDEQLAELRTIRDPEPVKPSGPARSRIGSTNKVIRPIDRVAGRVFKIEK